MNPEPLLGSAPSNNSGNPLDNGAGRDVPLGVDGFAWRDLHDVHRLPDLMSAFDRWLESSDPEVMASLRHYRDQHERMSATDVSATLVRVAPWVSRFVARLFRIEAEMARIAEATQAQDVVLRFRRDFVQRRVAKKFGTAANPFPPLSGVSSPEDLAGLAAASDPEKALADHVVALMDRETALAAGGESAELAATRERLEASVRYVAALLGDAERGPSSRYHHWSSLRLPRPVVHDRLVQVIRPRSDLPNVTMGPMEHRRRRDGFKLTDPRMNPREVLAEVHYCIFCHERDKDSCSKGFDAPAGSPGRYRSNPLGIPLTGCPLDEKISEAHLVRSHGDPLGALALIIVDNPMAPGTGHRICNDCMKACIYQKQDPVNIPQIETAILSDVLALPWGFEIYSLLTRWNPLNVRRPYALPYNGFNVLVVGLGPAGYTLAHHLANDGFAVVGVDGLKIEPLPADLTGADGKPPRPVRDVTSLYRELDDRPLVGFGGVSEYGITVRWDKNFLAVMYLNLARRRKLRMYGGIRFGGTLTVDEAWDLGFDHIAIASGAGRPTVIDMKNNLLRGIRKASDFLMALQLTGAFKRDALSNLQTRLPAVVIGGGLTGVDTATELLAYYPLQVEKMLARYEALVSELGETRVRNMYDAEEEAILDEFLEHGRVVRGERARARAAGEKPDFIPLVRRWGGVTLAYRRRLQDSPAYRLNHEEVAKAFEEGITFAENLSPTEAVADENGHVKSMVFTRPTGSGEERVELPARTVLVAAGTVPNITYEKEHPGTFALDSRQRFFRGFRAAKEAGGGFRLEEDPNGFFTSHDAGGRFVTYYGDNHPRFNGNVVKAMASAKHGYPHVVELFADEIARLD
ncbi:MAG: FAD-dependent oxidoreductase, partial [Candidatus Polarisedimenticolia bacterium]